MELDQKIRARTPATPGKGVGREARASAENGSAKQKRRHPLQHLVETVLPHAAAEHLSTRLGETIPRTSAGRYRVLVSGVFDGRRTIDLFTYLGVSRQSGALVIGEQDAERVLLFRDGKLVGADSTVLFERLGRLLYQVESIEHSDSETLVDAEEKHGAHALLLWLPTQHLRWAVERRVWEVGAAIHFIKKGHFVFVEGEPTLLCPTVGLDPDEVAMEGERRLEAFRQGTKAEGDEPYAAPRMAPPPPALPRRLAPIEIDEHALALVLDRIREAENHASD